MTNLPVWVDEYRGRPFRLGARGPEAYDCWGLVRAVLHEVWRVPVPALEDIHRLGTRERLLAALESPEVLWVEAPSPRPGDVLTFVVERLHVGIVIAEGWMLHARAGEGVSTARYDRLPWSTVRIGPAFRPRAAAGAVR